MKAEKAVQMISVAALAATLAVVSACRQAASAEEPADRASRQYASAMAELQAGHVDAAIKGFEDVVRAEPGNGNAHFQLAALLEESKKYFLGAIVHYRLYLIIRPESDKAAVAADRLKSCETRYAAAILDKAGQESRFAAKIESLRKENEQSQVKIAKMSEALDGANRKIASLEKDVALKKKMFDSASALADDSSVPKSPRRRLRPTDAELLEDDSEGDRVLSSADIKNLRAMLDEDERTSAQQNLKSQIGSAGKEEPDSAPAASTAEAKPSAVSANPFAKKEKKPQKREIPDTYTVEEGDTLMGISARFYGTNRKWREIREANKTIISPDGRVKTGQVIKLP